MAETDLTIVILRKIQAELVSINERLDSTIVRLDSNDREHEAHRESFAAMMHQFSYLDRRITNVEEIAIKTATSLGMEAQGSGKVTR